jgi:pimeloyl-ACP methyl ester carboxylesterase
LEIVGLSMRRVSSDAVPAGRVVDLPGRGRAFVCDLDDAGPGAPTLLLLHGLGVTAHLNWFPAFAALRPHFRVVTMDLRGHGRGVPLRGHRFRLADCADDMAALLDALGIDQAIPVGYSLGGPVAQLVWRRHPDRVAGLVLCATSRNFGGSFQERAFFNTLVATMYGLRAAQSLPWFRRSPAAPAGAAAAGDAGAGVVALGAFEEADEPDVVGRRLPAWAIGELRRISPSTIFQAMSAMGRFSSHRWIGEVGVPTAVVITTRDRLVAPNRQLKLARAIRDVTLHPVSAGHAACVLDSRRFVPVLVEACESVAARLPSSTGEPTARAG